MTTVDLAEYINQHSYKGIRTGGGHPAAQIFQALRIAVNQELHVLEQTLPQTLPFLKKGARLVIIAFHSLEDRIVKKFLRQYSARSKNQKYPRNAITKKDTPMLHILTNKAIQPSEDEIRKNPRARSARMRVAERII
jgi:16S rRNA (cytosine1402-N4)-methyltransferase